MKRRRVLVCGSNYGRIYFEALRRKPSAYEAAGLLARGRPRSAALARSEGVPLYRAVQEIPPGIDLACVALGMGAEQVTLDLLRRGIPLVCEHPQRPVFLARALRVSQERRTPFHLNSHFAGLEAPRTFLFEARRLLACEPLALFQAQATDRSLYGLIDIAAHALSGLSPGRFRAVWRQSAFVTLRGRLGGAPAMFDVQWPRGQLADGSADYLFDFRIALGFPSGILTLCSMAGPVVWNRNLGRVGRKADPLWGVAGSVRRRTLESFAESRIQATLAALDALAAEVSTGRRPPEQSPGHILAVSRLWRRLALLAGSRNTGR